MLPLKEGEDHVDCAVPAGPRRGNRAKPKLAANRPEYQRIDQKDKKDSKSNSGKDEHGEAKQIPAPANRAINQQPKPIIAPSVKDAVGLVNFEICCIFT